MGSKLNFVFMSVVLLAANTAFAETSCSVTFDTCSASGIKGGLVILDTFEKSNLNPLRCLARAQEWQDYCKNVSFDPSVGIIRAEFKKDGVVLFAEKAAPKPFVGCQIYISQSLRCPLSQAFYDNFESSATNKSRCLARAVEWQQYCDSPGVDATFMNGAEFTTATAVPGSVTVINQKAPQAPTLKYDFK